MAKTDPARALMKRLQKMEKVHTRLEDVAGRIGAQADALANLSKATRKRPGAAKTKAARRSRSSSPRSRRA